jgi:hypothetical protein
VIVYFGKFLKIAEVAHIFGGYFFPTFKDMYFYRQKCIELRFWRYFHKLIWSPFLDGTVCVFPEKGLPTVFNDCLSLKKE